MACSEPIDMQIQTKKSQHGLVYKTAALRAVHETARDVHAAGVLSRKALRTFDSLCLDKNQS